MRNEPALLGRGFIQQAIAVDHLMIGIAEQSEGERLRLFPFNRLTNTLMHAMMKGGTFPLMELSPDKGLKSKKIPSWFPTAIGYTLSIACLIWVFHRVNLQEMLEDFRSLEWRYVTIAVIADLSVYLCHAWRWTIVLEPVGAASFWRSVQAIYIGLFTNEVLPLRPGELIRSYLLSHWSHIPMPLTVSSVAVERLIDGVWMVAAFFVTAQFLNLPKSVIRGSEVLGAAVLVLGLLLAFIVLRKQHAHAVVAESRWASGLRHVIEGLHEMGKWRTMSKAAIVSLLYLVLQIVPVWALMEGFDLGPSFWVAAVVLIIMRLGTLLPSAPANIGLLQGSIILALGLFDVPRSVARNFSAILSAVITLPLLAGGSIALALTGLKLGEIRHRARTSMRTAATTPAHEN